METSETRQRTADRLLRNRPLSSDAFNIDLAMGYVGDKQILGELVCSILEETPRQMERIGIAIEQLDRKTLRLESHALKSSVAMIGASEASYAAAKLEFADGESVGRYHVDLQTRVDTLLDALATHFSE